MNRESNARFGLSDTLMLAAVVMWGINFILVKIALRELSPAGFNGLRILLTAALFLLLLAVSGRGFGIQKGDIGKLFVIGVVGNAVYQVLFIRAMSLTTASNTSLILSLSPVFVVLLGVLLRVERIHWAAWAGIAISLGGLYLVITRQNGGLHFSAASFKGDLAIFGGTMIWAAYTVMSKPFLERISPLQFSTITMGFGALFYVPLTAKDIGRIPWKAVSPQAWTALILSAFFGLILGYLIWYYSVKKVGNAKTAIYSTLTPVFTVVFASIFLREKIHGFQIAGALIIFAGVYMTRAGYKFFHKAGSDP